MFLCMYAHMSNCTHTCKNINAYVWINACICITIYILIYSCECIHMVSVLDLGNLGQDEISV